MVMTYDEQRSSKSGKMDRYGASMCVRDAARQSAGLCLAHGAKRKPGIDCHIYEGRALALRWFGQ
jgi:hypothetical protein